MGLLPGRQTYVFNAAGGQACCACCTCEAAVARVQLCGAGISVLPVVAAVWQATCYYDMII
jgi:hypothetical protein